MANSTSPRFTPPVKTGLVLSAVLMLAACGSSDAPPTTQAPRPVLVATVQQAPLGGLSFAGEIRAKERAEMAFAVAGIVREVAVEPGATVRRGQLLARIDATAQQAQLDAAHADQQRLQAVLADAVRREQRLQIARDAGAASEAEWTAMQAEVQAARAALTAAQSQKTGLEWSRGQTELRAHFDGRVTLRQLEVGQTVGAGAPVLALEGRGRELWLSVPSQLALTVGDAVSMTGPTGQAEGRVLQLSARLEAGGARRVLLSVPDAWSTGDAVSVQLWPRNGQPTTLQVPLRAVLLDAAQPGKGEVLRLPAGAQVPERVAVTLGDVQGEQVEIRGGNLLAGEQVVLAGAQALAAGQAVTPVSRLR